MTEMLTPGRASRVLMIRYGVKVDPKTLKVWVANGIAKGCVRADGTTMVDPESCIKIRAEQLEAAREMADQQK